MRRQIASTIDPALPPLRSVVYLGACDRDEDVYSTELRPPPLPRARMPDRDWTLPGLSSSDCCRERRAMLWSPSNVAHLASCAPHSSFSASSLSPLPLHPPPSSASCLLLCVSNTARTGCEALTGRHTTSRGVIFKASSPRVASVLASWVVVGKSRNHTILASSAHALTQPTRTRRYPAVNLRSAAAAAGARTSLARNTQIY